MGKCRYFHKGELPWQNIKDNHADQCHKIQQMKMALSAKELCNNCPKEFATFLDYCKNLNFA